MSRDIDVTPAQRKIILSLLKTFLPNTTVWAYGSRARWSSRPQSDLDLVAFSTPEQERKVYALKEAFEESDLPFKVDFFVWDDVPEEFKPNIEEERVALVVSGNTPEGWEETTLGAKTVWRSGGTPSKKRDDFWNGNIPWISAVSMHTTRLADSNLKITPAGLSAGSKLAPRGSSLLLVRGSALLKTIPMGRAEKDVAFNQDVKAVIAQGSLKPDYLYFWLMAKRRELLEMVGLTGIGAGKLDTKHLQSMSLFLPPPDEQDSIITIAKALDDKIELNRRMKETLESMAQALFKSWFVDFDPVKAKMEGKQPEGMDAETADLFSNKLVESDLGLIPEGWEVTTLEGISEILNGFAFKSKDYTDTGTFVLRTKNFSDTGSVQRLSDDVYLPDSFLESHKKYLCEAYDFFLVMVGASIGKTSTLYDNCLPALRNQNMWCFRPKKIFEGRFYLNNAVKNLVKSNLQISSGSARNFFKKGDFKKFPVLIPDRKILLKFENESVAMFQKISINIQDIDSLTKIRDTLLPKLISGELSVAEVEKEPGVVL